MIIVIVLCISSLQATEVCNPADEKDKDIETTINLDKVKNDTSKESMQKWLEGKFALETYKVNYLLPYGYSTKEYVALGDLEYKNIEAELQVSFKLRIAKNLFGLHESYYASYSHKSFWQIYVYSSPFRETNYNPEAFVVIPIEDEYSIFKLRSVKLAIAHKSNGKPNTEGVSVDGTPIQNLSKSINYVYTTIRTQYGTLIADLTLMAPLGTGENLSDNPDIMEYIGYTKLKLTYFYYEHMFTLMGRGNFQHKRGAVEATYSYPLQDNINFYTKVFSGYGESLIDYNRELTKVAVGFSFSR
jgi:phospholipase A1